MKRPLHEAYAVCPPGLEPLCAAELQALGARAVKAERGGVSMRCTTRQLYAANLWSRVATRVLVRAAQFEATSFAGLESALRHEVDLDRWLGGRAPQLRVSAARSALYHTDAIAERAYGVWGRPESGEEADTAGPAGPAWASGPLGAASAAGAEDAEADPEVGDGPPLVVVRNVHNRFTVSVDCSGEPLYKRGWRQEVAKAPMRENLAAAMLLGCGWRPEQPLLDPFCGSGTIPIEAALLALNRPPGFARSFAFFDWPDFEPGTWASVIGQAAEAERDPAGWSIAGADRDAGAVAAATANAARADVEDVVTFTERPVSATPAVASGTEPGWVVTNPPYGARIDHGGDLRNLYARFGTTVREQLPGWSVAMLVADRRLAAHSGLSLHEALRFANGGIDVELLVATSGAKVGGRAPRERRG